MPDDGKDCGESSDKSDNYNPAVDFNGEMKDNHYTISTKGIMRVIIISSS